MKKFLRRLWAWLRPDFERLDRSVDPGLDIPTPKCWSVVMHTCDQVEQHGMTVNRYGIWHEVMQIENRGVRVQMEELREIIQRHVAPDPWADIKAKRAKEEKEQDALRAGS